MIRRIFDRVHGLPMTVQEWIVLFVAVVFLRIFLENFSGRNAQAFVTADTQTVLHYTLFYAVTALAILLLVSFWSQQHIRHAANVVLVGFTVILTPPLIDLILSGGRGMEMAYLFKPASGLVQNFLTFFGAHELPGITPGIRIELVVILGAIFTYVYTYVRSLVRGVLAVLSAYAVLFILLSAPSIIALGNTELWLYYILLARDSLVSLNALHPAFGYTSLLGSVEMGFNGVMSHVWYLLLVPLLAVTTYRISPEKWRAVVRNSRPERVAHYVLLVFFGIVLAFAYEKAPDVERTWLNAGSVVILLIAYYAAWMFSVGVNDIVDVESDRLSNSTRPLVTGVLSPADLRSANAVFLLLAVVGGYVVGSYALYFVLTFITLYYVYSTPPLHLKRFMIVNSFIVSLCALTAVLAGFFLVSMDDRVSAFPSLWLYLTVLVYTLLANIKDLKDIEGDKVARVYTVPVVFGELWGKRVVSLMLVLGLSALPLLTGHQKLWILVVPFAVIGTHLIHRKPFVERHLFYAYFIFIAAVALLIAG